MASDASSEQEPPADPAKIESRQVSTPIDGDFPVGFKPFKPKRGRGGGAAPKSSKKKRLAAPSADGGDPRSFSHLLSGALAASSRGMLAVPIVAVPCFIATPALLDASGITGQFTLSHQAVLASVTAHAQMQLQAGLTPPSSKQFPLRPVPIQKKPTPRSEEANRPSCALAAEKRQTTKDVRVISVDGYNWRKYGQKHVKSSKSSRSYYRCTLSTCSAKRKVERGQDGRLMEVTYQGEHNHEPPLRAKFSKERVTQCNRPPGEDGDLDQNNINEDQPDDSCMALPKGREPSGAERTEQFHCTSDCEGDTRSNTEDVVEPDAKMRLCESPVALPTPLSRTGKEIEVVMKPAYRCWSDGYRWRKYGQKIIKGSPNPRSYYRCTHAGCPARKHIEKAAEDELSVVITYEGKHIHDPPPSRTITIGRKTTAAAPTPVASTTECQSVPISSPSEGPQSGGRLHEKALEMVGTQSGGNLCKKTLEMVGKDQALETLCETALEMEVEEQALERVGKEQARETEENEQALETLCEKALEMLEKEQALKTAGKKQALEAGGNEQALESLCEKALETVGKEQTLETLCEKALDTVEKEQALETLRVKKEQALDMVVKETASTAAQNNRDANEISTVPQPASFDEKYTAVTVKSS